MKYILTVVLTIFIMLPAFAEDKSKTELDQNQIMNDFIKGDIEAVSKALKDEEGYNNANILLGEVVDLMTDGSEKYNQLSLPMQLLIRDLRSLDQNQMDRLLAMKNDEFDEFLELNYKQISHFKGFILYQFEAFIKMDSNQRKEYLQLDNDVQRKSYIDIIIPR